MKKKVFAVLMAFLVVSILVTSCSAEKSNSPGASMSSYRSTNDNSTKNEYYGEAEYDAKSDGGEIFKDITTSAASDMSSRKIIKNADISMQTLDFDKTLEDIKTLVDTMGGYYQSSQVSGANFNTYSDGTVRKNNNNRNAYFVVRIPAVKLDETIGTLSEIANVVQSNVYTDEITSQYFDTEARVKSLLVQEDRILEILKKAVVLKDVIELEQELSRIRYEIESLTGTLRKWDDLVSYSTISINLYEVQRLEVVEGTKTSLWGRISQNFSSSVKGVINGFQDFLVFFAGILPGLIIFGLIAFIIIFILFKINKNYKNKQTKKDNI